MTGRRRKADQSRRDRLRAGAERFLPRRKYPELVELTDARAAQ